MTKHKCNWQLGEDGSAICLDCTTVIGADGLIESLQEEIAALRESLGLLQIGHDHKATLLASCEIALGERDEKISTLQSDLAAAREELERAREALIDIWARHPNFPLNGKTPREQAEAHYAREISQAHRGEEG